MQRSWFHRMGGCGSWRVAFPVWVGRQENFREVFGKDLTHGKLARTFHPYWFRGSCPWFQEQQHEVHRGCGCCAGSGYDGHCGSCYPDRPGGCGSGRRSGAAAGCGWRDQRRRHRGRHHFLRYAAICCADCRQGRCFWPRQPDDAEELRDSIDEVRRFRGRAGWHEGLLPVEGCRWRGVPDLLRRNPHY